MNRKDFFRRLLLGSAGTFLLKNTAIAATPARQRIMLATDFIAGFKHYDGSEIENLLETGMTLQLNREPHNRYDINAVEIYSGDAKLGYLPRNMNTSIALLMDQGIEVQAEIKELNRDAFPYGSVKVEVWYEREYTTDSNIKK
jgi:hypothetical protein